MMKSVWSPNTKKSKIIWILKIGSKYVVQDHGKKNHHQKRSRKYLARNVNDLNLLELKMKSAEFKLEILLILNIVEEKLGRA